jgi:hypothetical protein
MEMIETGDVKRSSLTSRSAAIVAYVRAIGLQADDEQVLELKSPDGGVVAAYRPPKLERDQAQYFISAGKKLSGSGWARGTYAATYVLRRQDIEVVRKTFQVDVVE